MLETMVSRLMQWSATCELDVVASEVNFDLPNPSLVSLLRSLSIRIDVLVWVRVFAQVLFDNFFTAHGASIICF